MKPYDYMKPYEELANAIVTHAVTDWRCAVAKLKNKPEDKKQIGLKEDCERFFRSKWFRDITDVDGEVVLKRLKNEERGIG